MSRLEELATWTGTLRRTARFVRKRGLRRSLRRAFEAIDDLGSRILRGQTAYERWFADQLEARASVLDPGAGPGPLVSIVMPVCDPDVRWLEQALASVRRQTYPRWQLCIVDDASANPQVRGLLEQWRDREPRVELLYNDSRQGISRTSNRALSIARGEYVALLDHDDELTADALSLVVSRARAQPFDLLYSDEDKITRSGRLRDPAFKPDRSSDLLRTCMYFGHLCVYRRAFLEELGGFDPVFDGSQDWELALRADTRARRIVHLPAVLYHWRMAHGSTADPNAEAKPWAYEAGRRAVETDIARRGERAHIVEGAGRGYARIVRAPQPDRKVSVLRGSGDAADPTQPPCGGVDGVGSTGRPQAGVRLDPSGVDAAPHAIGLEVEWLAIDPAGSPADPGVAARWNAAAARAQGGVLVFLDGVRPRDETSADAWRAWLAEIVATVEREPVGVVGARISSRRGVILHMGVVVGGPEMVRTFTGGLRRDEPGPLGIAQSLREVSAITGGCLAVRRDVFDRIGGFDPGYATALHDVDFCLRAWELGLRVLCDPHAECTPCLEPTAASGRTRSTAVHTDDLRRLQTKWSAQLARPDPFSNPGYHQEGALFTPRYRPICRPRGET